MTIRIITVVMVAALGFLDAPLAFSHHSNSAFAVTTIITVKGVVKDFQWVNPHTWIILDVDDGTGSVVTWRCEGRAPSILRRVGWSKSVLKIGEKVTVDMRPSKDGSKTGLVGRVTKEDGTFLRTPGGLSSILMQFGWR